MKYLKSIVLIFTLLIITQISFATVTVLNGLTHVYNGNSGEELSGEVVLFNSSSKPQLVNFEINEALFSCEAYRVFTEKNPHEQSSSDWFKGGLMTKQMEPNERFVYRYSIQIPFDENLRGSFWSMLMITVDDPIREEVVGNNIGLATKIRYAIGLLTNVNGFDEVDLEFEAVKLQKDNEAASKTLDIKVKNLGEFIEGVTLTLEVYDSNGKKVTEFKTDRNIVFPGVCRLYKLDISQLPPDQYECLLLADSREEFTGTNLSFSTK